MKAPVAVTLLLTFILPILGQDAAKRTSVPAEAAQADAAKLIKEVYGDEWAKAKTSAEKQSLAKKLIGKANESKDDPASQFVLLRLARDIATQAGDGQTAFQAIDLMADAFQTDADQMKSAVLTKLAAAAQKPAQHKVIAEEALRLIDQAVSQDSFTFADELGKLALGEARKSFDKVVLALAQGRIKQMAELSKAFEEVKAAKATLNRTPDDPNANLVVGKHICFVQGNWKKGVAMLALGKDEALRALAKQELQGAASSTEQAKLGDGWWNLAENQEGPDRKRMQERAVYWYRQALPGLSGIAKDKLEKRVEKAAQLAASSPNHKVKWLLLFNSSDAAVWNTDSPDEKSFAIPLARVPDSIKYLKMQLDPKRVVIIPMAKDKIATLSSNGKFGWEGTNHVVWGGRQLGIFDKTIIIGHEGYKGGPCISWDNGGFSGFGFGYNPGVNNQGYGWDGKAIDQTVFEIYVTSESLSSSERLSLLK